MTEMMERKDGELTTAANKAYINSFLVNVFNEILKTEEQSIEKSAFSNLSLREMHVIEAVCKAEAAPTDNRATAIAADLRITAGSLTTAVTLLEQKGYLSRVRDEKDKRVVRIVSTELGRAANRCHQQFHLEMVDSIYDVLSPSELDGMMKGLASLSDFFAEKYQKK